jgi:hypothetical protein
MQGVSEKFYNGILNVNLWRVLRKRLYLRQTFHLSTFWMMNSLYASKCERFRNTRDTVTFGIPL